MICFEVYIEFVGDMYEVFDVVVVDVFVYVGKCY